MKWLNYTMTTKDCRAYPGNFHFSLFTLHFSLLLCILCAACHHPKQNSPFEALQQEQTFDLQQIQDQGELIILTMYGPDTYFEYKGGHFGRQYLLADAFARSIGTSIRVEVCRSGEELQSRLAMGDGDIVACNVPDSLQTDENKYFRADTIIQSWAVSKQSPALADALAKWIRANKGKLVALSTIQIRTSTGKTYRPRRRVSAPIRNLAKGEISVYDHLFRQYARQCNWDWRLLAAQAYQESAFDAEAVSFMGAMGLMQLMPGTARDVGVSQQDVFHPESNIRGAVRLINQLNQHYAAIHSEQERINFILAAYNAGPGHVDDARALARKFGKDPDRWLGNVDGYVLRMAEPRFYNLPEVQHGYFRGSETYDYVNSIRVRWEEYKRVRP